MILNKRSKAPVTEDLTYLFGQPEKPIGQWGIEKKNDSDAIKVSLSDCLGVQRLHHVRGDGAPRGAERRRVQAAGGGVRASGGRRVTVVSVAPQSRASLAHAAGLSALDAAKRLTGFFKSMGVVAVFDTTAARDFSLLEAGEESRPSASAASRGLGSNQSQNQNQSQSQSQNQNQNQSQNPNPLPVLASACPGWVCYAEKQSPGCCPTFSNVKSPQQVMGTIVKRRVAASLGLDPAAVFHVAVMPCYDKKLEASRGDFRGEPGVGGGDGEGPPDVDCVLTTGEVAEASRGCVRYRREGEGRVLDRGGGREGGRGGAGEGTARAPRRVARVVWNRAEAESELLGCRAPDADVDMDVDVDAHVDADVDAFGCLGIGCERRVGVGLRLEGGRRGSGNFEHASGTPRKLSSGSRFRGALEYKIPRARNPDLREVTLEGPDGTTLLRFAQAYGFRNIQNMVRKIKPTAHDIHLGTSRDGCGYDYVEIMACPSGCLNGGGQLRRRRRGEIAGSGAARPRR